jgi:ATP synthase protein I
MSSTGDGDREERKAPPESSERLRERLRDLERKLEPEGEKREGMSDAELEKRSSTLGKAFKVSTELVAGVFVGGFIGWALDTLLMPKLGVSTSPLFLIVFLLLGIAAGFLNVFRAAREMGEK